MRAHPCQDDYEALFARCSRVMQSIVGLPCPGHRPRAGPATAAGCQLVASCDLAVAAESARFAVSGIDVGLFCSTPAVALSRNVSPKHAFDMLVTGRFISAAEALSYGLVSRMAPDAGLDEAVTALRGGDLLEEPCRGADREGHVRPSARHEPRGRLCLCRQGHGRQHDGGGHAEGIDAFIAKRKPVWTGAERRAPILHGLARAISRSRNFCTLPVDVLGISANRMVRGHLNAASLAAPGDQLVRRDALARLELDEGARRLAPFLVGLRHDRRQLHGGMLEERVLHLDRGDVLAARDDDVLGAVLQLDVAVRILDPEIAGTEPAAFEGLLRRLRVLR